MACAHNERKGYAMALRYCGDAVISLTYYGDARGRDAYKGTIKAGGFVWAFDALHPPAAGFPNGAPCGSPEAYDAMARSALSFGSYYTTHNRGGEVPAWAPSAMVADAISEATSWSTDDCGEFIVFRSRAAATV